MRVQNLQNGPLKCWQKPFRVQKHELRFRDIEYRAKLKYRDKNPVMIISLTVLKWFYVVRVSWKHFLHVDASPHVHRTSSPPVKMLSHVWTEMEMEYSYIERSRKV